MTRSTLTVQENTLARFNKNKGHYQSVTGGITIDADEFLNKLLDMYETAVQVAKQLGEWEAT